MKISSSAIASLLKESDLEGYISFGAPDDEYDSEAEVIALALSELDYTKIDTKSLATIVSEIWQKSFDLASADLEVRYPAIENFATRLIQNSLSS
jgi:hypothetical protein